MASFSSMTPNNAARDKNADGTSRSPRLNNASSFASLNSADSVSPDHHDRTRSSFPPHSPMPQLPHAPSPLQRHISPNGKAQANAAAASQTVALEAKTSHGNATGLTPASASQAVHHPAPHGFLAKMSAEDLQESVRQAIAGAGADGVMRNYRINEPPRDRPVRIYADGVYDLVSRWKRGLGQGTTYLHIMHSSTMDTLWRFDKPSWLSQTYTCW